MPFNRSGHFSPLNDWAKVWHCKKCCHLYEFQYIYLCSSIDAAVCVYRTHRRVLCVGCEWASAGRSSWLASRRNCRSCARRTRTPDQMSAGKPRGTRTLAHHSWPHTPPRDHTPYPRTGWVCWDLTQERESRVSRWSVIPSNATQRLEREFLEWGQGQGTVREVRA